MNSPPAYSVSAGGIFLSTKWLFHLPNSVRNELLSRRDDWGELSRVLIQCQQGNFTELQKVASIFLRSRDIAVVDACAMFLGYAAPRSLLRTVTRTVLGLPRPSLEDRGFLTKMLGGCRELWVVPILVRILAEYGGLDQNHSIPWVVSELLEEEWEDGPLFMAEMSTKEYIHLVSERLSVIETICPSQDVAIRMGRILSVKEIAQILEQLLIPEKYGEDDIPEHRVPFEAYTGIACGACLDERGRMLPLCLRAQVDSFLDGRHALRFTPGVRYFFGHRVPE